MNTDDPFYKYAPPPDITEPGVHFQYRSPENDWASDKAQANGSGGGSSHPLQLYKATVSSAVKVRVRYGSVWGSVPPEVQGGVSPVDITPSDGLLIWARVDVDVDGLPEAVAIGAGTTQPDDDDTTTYFLIGSIAVDGSTITLNQAVTHSLNGKACGVGVYDWWGV